MGCRQGKHQPPKAPAHFADAVAVFEDGSAITIPDDDSGEEERFITIGRDSFDRLLVVIYTWRGLYIGTRAEPLEKTLRRVIREELRKKGAA